MNISSFLFYNGLGKTSGIKFHPEHLLYMSLRNHKVVGSLAQRTEKTGICSREFSLYEVCEYYTENTYFGLLVI